MEMQNKIKQKQHQTKTSRLPMSVNLFKMFLLLLSAVKYLCIFPTVFFLPQGKIALKNAANYFVYYIQGY